MDFNVDFIISCPSTVDYTPLDVFSSSCDSVNNSISDFLEVFNEVSQ